jgi:uncharacterized protein (TIGR03435 family)
MKHFVPLLALAALPLCAQNITGDWQGALKVGPQELRIVIKVTLDDDKPKAVMYSIDQGGAPINATTFTKDGSLVKFTIAVINGSYEGKLSADGNTITGNWTQGQPIPLTLTRATPATAWTIPEPLPPPKTMAADAQPKVEVATIKPAKPGGGFSILVNRSGLLTTTDTSLSDLIKFAYDLHPRQITGGPGWVESEKYDVTVKADTPGIPNGKQLKTIMQQLLAERFQLTFHLDKKELSVYAISVAKGGAKITKSDNAGSLPGFGGGPRGLTVRNATIAEFGHMMQANILDRPVVDQTGFGTTRYDFSLKWTPDGPQAQPAADDAPPDLFAAFQQQLGLRLESTKAPVDVLVVDKVEKPSAN